MRRHGQSAIAPAPDRGYARLYRRSVLPAAQGCDFDTHRRRVGITALMLQSADGRRGRDDASGGPRARRHINSCNSSIEVRLFGSSSTTLHFGADAIAGREKRIPIMADQDAGDILRLEAGEHPNLVQAANAEKSGSARISGCSGTI